MLIGIDPILPPDLLQILRAMGHGDEIVIVDVNYPATSSAKRLIRMDGIPATRVLKAILGLMPLDDFVDDPANIMQVVGDANAVPPVIEEFQKIIDDNADNPARITSVERFDFYDRAKAAYAIVQSGEARLYGNIMLKKGIIRPDVR